MMRDVVIVEGARRSVGWFRAGLRLTPVVALGVLALKSTLKKAGLRPVASKRRTRFEPNALKGKGLMDQESEARDDDDVLQPVSI